MRKLASVRVDEGAAAGRSGYALVVNPTHVSKPSGARGCPASPARSDSASKAPVCGSTITVPVPARTVVTLAITTTLADVDGQALASAFRVVSGG